MSNISSKSASARAMKADARIQRAAAAAGCLPESIDWMESCLDPFPDMERRISGYPDMVIGKSIVQSFRQKSTVSAPASASGNNWDAHIFCDGFFNGNNVCETICGSAGVYNIFQQTGQSATLYQEGGVSVRSGPAGDPLYITNTDNTASMYPVVDTSVPFRVIACAVEVWNTTAPLYRQGNVIYWRQPKGNTISTAGITNTINTTNIITPTDVFYPTQCPENATDALILGGSISTEAEKGAYLVGTLGSQDIPVTYAKEYSGGGHAVFTTSNSKLYFSVINGSTSPLNCVANPFPTSFNAFGAYFTGLSNQTTLDVVWHYIIERFPSPRNTDLVTMASNSSPYDPRALELYSRTAWKLPTGVWVEDNGLGDWICDVADILGTLGVPGMGIVKGVTKGIQAVSNMMDDKYPVTSAPQQRAVVEVIEPEKRERMNAKASKRGKQPRQGPLTVNNKFKSPQAKSIKRARRRRRKEIINNYEY
jgi:hypothetical protein